MSEESLELSSDEVPVVAPQQTVETDKDNIATPKEHSEESSGETYVTEESEEPEEEPVPKKTGKLTAKEAAFKKIDFAANDPILLDHRTERRALAKRLEEDPEFRAAYIAREEKLRKQRELEEEAGSEFSESLNDDDINEAIRTVHKLQGNYVSEEEADVVDVMEGVSDDGSVDISGEWVEEDKPKKSKKSSKKSKKSKKGRIGINIEKLVINKLVLRI